MRIARLLPIPRAAQTASWLVLLLSLAGPAAPASAQRVLVSNIEQANQFQTALSSRDLALAFTTGTNTDGYTLTSVEVKFGTTAPTGVSVKLATGVSRTSAGTEVATLTNPSPLTAGDNTFTAPAGTVLSASTTYFVIVEGTGGHVRRTTSTAEDATGLSDWSIADLRRERSASSTGAFDSQSTNVFMIRVNGAAASSGPTVTIAAGTSPVTEGTAASFTLTASSAPSSDLTVNLAVSEASGSDYVAAGDEGTKTVTISSGSTTATYSVTTQDDSTDEPNGSVTVTVSSGTGYTVGTTSSAMVSVNDNDAAPPAVPMGCGAAGTHAPDASVTHAPNGFFTARATNREIILTLSSTLNSTWWLYLDGYVCSPGSGGTYSATLLATLSHDNIPGGEIWATGLKPDTDHWVKLTNNYLGELTQWHKVRTASGSVWLTLNDAGADNTYHSGDAIEITAVFGDQVTVTGTPRIPFLIGSTTRYATYSHSKGDGLALVFSYTVQAADADTDGITVAANALELNGGTINLTTDGTAAALDHPAVTASTSHKVAGSPGPTITITGGSTVTEGTAAEFTLTASPAPSSDLTVNLTVSESATGDYVASGDEGAKTVTIKSDSTTATYSVTTQDDSTDENAGEVRAVLSSGTGYSVGSDSRASVTVYDNDGAGAVSLALNSAGADNTYHNGDAIEITATFGESVTVGGSGTPRIPFTIGTTERHATYASGSPGTALVFSYTVQTADLDTDGITVAVNAIDLNGGTINRTVGGDAVALDHAAVAASTSHTVHGGGASVSSVEFTNQPTGTYATIGGDIEVTVTFDRPVTVTNTPRIQLSPVFGPGDPKVTRYANYAEGSGKTKLVFRYTLVEGDDSGGTQVSVGANALALNGGTIRTGTAAATISHTPANSSKAVLVKRPKINAVTVSPGPTVNADLMGAAETYVRNDDITVTVGFDQNIDVDTKGQNSHVQIVLQIGTTDYALVYSSGSGTAGITFAAQPVTSTDRDDDGITLKRQSATNHVIRLSGSATIKGTAANGANDAVLSRDADPKVEWRPTGEDPVTSLNVRGTNEAPTSSNNRVTTDTDTDYTFRVADFTFSDSESDPLKEVQIVTLPTGTHGALKLSGAAVTANQTVSRADIANLVFDPVATFEDDASFTFKAVDSFGAASAAAATMTIAVGASVSLSFNSAGADNTYHTNDAIEITATFGEPVTVGTAGGRPRIPFTIGTTERHAVYSSGSGTAALVFSYTVVAADVDADGIEVAENALHLNGGTIVLTSNPATAAALDHAAVPASASHKVGVAKPAAPATPGVSTTDGTTLTVTWTAPPNTRPDITDYDVEGRRKNVPGGDPTDWNDAGHTGTAVTATITGLVQGASYEARVRATNAEGTSDWSAIGTGHTGPARVESAETSAGGIWVHITFTKTITQSAAASNYRVAVNGTERTPTGVSVVEGVLSLQLPGDAVTHGQTVTVRYTRPATGVKLQDADGLDIASFSGQSVTNTVPAPVPTVTKATLQGTQLDITFSQALGALPPQLPDAFTVKLGTTAQALRSNAPMSINGSVLSIILAAAPGAGAVTVSYAKPATNTLKGANGSEVESFTDQAVIRPATVSSATTDETGRLVYVTFNKDIFASSAASPWRVVIAGTERQPEGVAISSEDDAILVLSLAASHAITPGQTVTVKYTKPTAGAKVLDTDRLEVESFTGQSVTNTVPTVFQSATTNSGGTAVGIRFTSNLTGTGNVAVSAYTVTVNGTDQNPTSIGVATGGLLLGLGTAITVGQTVTVSYAKPATGNKLLDASGREIDSFTDQPVTNAVPATITGLEITSDPGADLTYQRDDKIRVTVTFDAPVTVTTAGTPTTGPRVILHFDRVIAAQRGKPAVYESGSGTAQLVFAYTVVQADASTEGVGLPANGLELNGGAIKTGTTDATLTYAAVNHDGNHKVTGATAQDVTGPAVSGAPTVNGASLVITFNEALDATGTAPAASAFTVKVDGTAVDLADTNPVAVSGSAVTLTLAAAVIDTSVVTVAYDKPSANPIQDFTAGNDAPSFGDTDVTNNTPGVAPTAPVAPGVSTTDGTTLTVTWAEPPGARPAITDYDVEYRRKNVPGGDPTDWTDASHTGTAVTATITGLVRGASYEARVRATNAEGTSDWSTAASGHTGPARIVSADTDTDGTDIRGSFTKTLLRSGRSDAYRVFVDGTARGIPPRSTFAVTPDGLLTGDIPGAAVQFGQTVTFDYARPAGNNAADHLTDADGLRLASFPQFTVTNTVPAPVPVVTKATLQGTSLKITFSRALNTAALPAASAFTVKLGTANQSLAGTNPVAISGSVVTLTLAAAPGAGTVTVSYAKPATNPLKGADGTDVESFTDQTVIRPATVQSATTNETGRLVYVTFNKDIFAPGAASPWRVVIAGTERQPGAVSISSEDDATLVLSLAASHAITPGQTVTVKYTKPTTGAKVLDTDRLEVESFTGQSVTNIVPSTFQSATTFVPSGSDRANIVELTFNFRLKGPDPVASAFTITAGGTDITPTEALIVINKLNLNLPTTGKQIAPGETVTVSYEKPATGNKLIDNNDREVAEFTDQPVTNTVPVTITQVAITSDPGADRIYQRDDVIRVTVTFSAPVTVNTTDGTPHLILHFQGGDGALPAQRNKQASYESGSGTNMLVFAYTVVQADDSAAGTAAAKGVAVKPNGIQLNNGTIRTGTTDATLTHSAVQHAANHQVNGSTAQDTTGPAVSTTTLPTVNGASLVITFNEALDATGTAPAASAFTVKVGGTAVDLADTNPVALSGSAVTLTLAAAVIDADRVTVAYNQPATNPIRDFTAGNDAPSFGDTNVTNNTPDVAPTVLTDPAPVVGGTRLVITFSEPLWDTGPGIPATSAFTVLVAGNSRGVSNVDVSGSTVILTLESAAVFGEAVTVSYTQPAVTEPKLQDRVDPTPNPVASFGPLTVTNNDNTAPSFSSAAVDGATLTITFDENLDATSEPAPAAFTVRVDGANRSVSDVDLSGATVTLTLTPAVTPGQAVTVNYAQPAANPLQDGAANKVANFGHNLRTNNTRSAVTGAPAVTSTPASGDTYGLGEHIEFTVTFSHPVTVTGTPQLELAVGSNNRQAAYQRSNGATALVFRYTVVAADADADGISVGENKLTLNGGTIQDAGNGAATLTHAALATQPGHKVDGTLTRTAVTIAGGGPVAEGGNATFTLTAAPASPTALTVNLQVSQSGNFVADADLGSKTVTVPTSGTATYTVPTVNDATDEPNGSVTVTVQAGTGYTVGAPATASVTVNDNDASAPPPPPTPTRPAFSRAAVSGTALTITFNRNLDAGSAPAGSAFTVTATPAGGTARTISGTGTASIAGATVTVTLESAVASGETVRVAYTSPSTNPLRGAGSGGREVANFSGRTVANNTPTGPSSPPPQGGRVSGGGATVTLNFADELDASSTPDPGDFTVTVAAASDAGSGAGSPAADDHYRVTAVSIAGATLELTISPPVPEDREASVSYTPGARPLRTAAAAAVPNFSVTVSAATPPPPPPPANRAPAFDPSRYAFELREHVDGSAQPVALGAVTAADPDGDALSYALAAGDSARFAVGSGDGAVTYVGPGEDFETEPNAYELTVRASDPGGLSAEASVTVTIVDVVELPVAVDDTVATDEDVAVTVEVLANDMDPEGGGLRVASVSAAEQGSAEVTADGGAVRYTPPANWHGTDRFTYVAEGANGATSEAAVEVTVRPVNDAPEAAADTASTDEDVAVEVDVLANDTDIEGDSLRVASVSAPANGTAAITADGRGVLYTPAENWHGTDAFTYVADDGNGGTASASVEVTVAPVNDLPTAVDDKATTNEDEAVTVDVLANDTDPDGDGLRLASVSAPENGTARIAAGVILYMPAANFSGTDRFTYEVEDDGGARASAAVEVTVLPTNDAPMPVGTIPAQSLEEGGEPARIELSPFFEDADGEVLAYGTVSSDSSIVRATVAGSVLTLVPAGYGRVVVVVAARDAGGLTATQALAVSVSDGAAREMVSHTLAGMARSHLASARMTLGRRPMVSRSPASRLSLMGRDVPLGVDEAKSTARQMWDGWLSGVTSRAMSYARPDSSSTGSASDDPTLGELFRFGDLVGSLTRFEGGQDPLRGSEFQFAFGGGGGSGGAQDAGGGGGLRFQLWGQGDVQTFRGAPSDGNDYDGELQTGYVGLDTWLGSRFMLGVAVARSQGTGDWRTGATSGALETRLVAVHPYLQWTSGATSIWAMAGAGRGDANNVRDGNGLMETSDLGLRMGLVELRRRLAAGGGFSLALRADAGWAELQTETGSETLDGQTAAVDQLRFGAELSQQLRLGGLTLNPFGEAHVRRDGGAGQPGTGLELTGGLRAKAGFLRLDAQGRMLAVHSATGYEEQGFSATLSLGSQGGTGPSLSVSPRWGDLATGGGDALWQEQVYGRHAPAAPSADGAPHARGPWALDVSGNYGIRLPGDRLLTWSATVNHSPLGPRYTTALQIAFAGAARPSPPVP